MGIRWLGFTRVVMLVLCVTFPARLVNARETGSGAVSQEAYAALAWFPNLPSVIQNPSVLSPPSPDSASNVYPGKALGEEVNGAAYLMCLVDLDGIARSCRVDWEAPTGYGFGKAALKLAGQYRFTVGREEGRPVVRAVLVPVNFTAFPERVRPSLQDRPIQARFAEPGSGIAPPGEVANYPLPTGGLTALAVIEGDGMVFWQEKKP